MLNLSRPTREKSYLRGSKNMPLKSAVAVSVVGGSPGRIFRYNSISASWGVLKLSRESVWLMTGPTSSRSGKKMLSSVTLESWIELSALEVSALLASRSTSPVEVSTMSTAEKAPSTSCGAISTCVICAFCISLRAAAVIFRPACRTVSCVRGCSISFEIFHPSSPLETSQYSLRSLSVIFSAL